MITALISQTRKIDVAIIPMPHVLATAQPIGCSGHQWKLWWAKISSQATNAPMPSPMYSPPVNCVWLLIHVARVSYPLFALPKASLNPSAPVVS